MYDFYFRVYNKLIQDIKVPFKMDGGTRIDDTPVHQALREALANCLVNADYYGRQGLVIVKKRNSITMSNPGSFRIEIDAAKSGGVSDPRNGTMLKMFNLIDIGERAGSGIPNIFRVWREQNWTTPEITEQLEPERTILSRAFEKASDKKQAIKASNSTIYSRQKQSVIEYLTHEIQADCKTIADLLEISSPRARAVLTKMVKEEIIITEGGNRNRTYIDRVIETRFTDDYFSLTLPNELNSAAAISPAWYGYVAAQIVLNIPMLFSNTPVSKYFILGSSGTKNAIDRHHIFPKNYLSGIGFTSDRDRNQIANFTYLDYATNIEISDKAPQDYVYHYRQKLGEDGYRKACEEHALPKNFEGMEYIEFLSQRRILMAQTVRKAYQRL